MADPIDLSHVLAQPVAGGNQQPLFSLDNNEPIEQSPVELEPETEPEPGQITTTQPGNQDYYTDEEPQSLSPDDLSIIGVNILDGIQKMLLTMARKKIVFSEAELNIIDRIDHGNNKLYEPGTPEAIAKEKWRKHLQAIEKLPFNEGEKKRLIDATTIYARTTQIKVSPFTGLLLAYGEVLGTRAIDVFSEI